MMTSYEAVRYEYRYIILAAELHSTAAGTMHLTYTEDESICHREK